jgi:hypothetical protein
LLALLLSSARYLEHVALHLLLLELGPHRHERLPLDGRGVRDALLQQRKPSGIWYLTSETAAASLP